MAVCPDCGGRMYYAARVCSLCAVPHQPSTAATDPQIILVRWTLRSRRMTLKTLSALSGVSRSSLSALFRGVNRPRADTMEQLAPALGLHRCPLCAGAGWTDKEPI